MSGLARVSSWCTLSRRRSIRAAPRAVRALHPEGTLMKLFSDSIGRKAVMAVTGLLMVLFVVGHLLGNLTIFAGADGINAYAFHLHERAPVVWITRVVMGVAVVLLYVISIQVTMENSKAKPDNYAVTQ